MASSVVALLCKITQKHNNTKTVNITLDKNVMIYSSSDRQVTHHPPDVLGWSASNGCCVRLHAEVQPQSSCQPGDPGTVCGVCPEVGGTPGALSSQGADLGDPFGT